MTVESILNHPFITGKNIHGLLPKEMVPAGTNLSPPELRDAVEEAIDIKTYYMTPEQAEQNLRLGSTGQKLKIDPVDVKQERQLEQILSRGGENIEYREIYGPELQGYEYGVIDSG